MNLSRMATKEELQELKDFTVDKELYLLLEIWSEVDPVFESIDHLLSNQLVILLEEWI